MFFNSSILNNDCFVSSLLFSVFLGLKIVSVITLIYSLFVLLGLNTFLSVSI